MKLILFFTFVTLSLCACLNRTVAVNRAMQWVTAKVPYNANANHDGYVQGCEGIVGYGWEFPKPGVYSGDLMNQGWCKKITKDQLLMGDIMVCPGSHQLLFHSWVDSAKTQYTAIELSPSGSNKHVLPYPYWSSYNPGCYVPCRVEKACAVGPE